jgi:protoporphyrinogen oxidase
MRNVAIVGAGITGLSTGQLLRDRCRVTIFEKARTIGGLIKCDRVRDNLFHRVGGHVFNSRNQAVLDWFWGFFDRDTEFVSAKRNAKILLQGKLVGYPLENYLWQLDSGIVDRVVADLLRIQRAGPLRRPEEYPHFEAFLRGNFGDTLYDLYFQPYNRKIWNTDLQRVPLGWLEGKLPMPNLQQMLISNIVRQEESQMVHSTFYYARENGSQFIIDRLARGLETRTGVPVNSLIDTGSSWVVNGETFDCVVFTGDVRTLAGLVESDHVDLLEALRAISDLRSNGTSNLFCETDITDISWLYLPDPDIPAHRVIYTGTFAASNNRGSDRLTCVVEFSGHRDRAEMERHVARLPGNMRALDHNHEPNSYVVQYPDTRDRIGAARRLLANRNFYLAGRFAEWEYHNMDKAIEAAMAAAALVT